MIEHRLRSLATEHLEVLDESAMHSGGGGAESHFKVVIVSDTFAGVPLVSRHRTINAALAEEFSRGMHALTIAAYSPAEWAARNGHAPDSPKCAGQRPVAANS